MEAQNIWSPQLVNFSPNFLRIICIKNTNHHKEILVQLLWTGKKKKRIFTLAQSESDD
jgi:hypothetical protein